MKLYFFRIFWSAAMTLLLSPIVNANTESTECIKDLRYLPDFLLANDTGAKAHLKQYGQKHFNDALSEAISKAKSVAQASDCELILDQYLKSWRHGHLAVAKTEQLEKTNQTKKTTEKTEKIENLADTQPSVEFLSAATVLLTLPSFEAKYREPLAQLLKDNRHKLASAPNWIIDVRNNRGGSDETYSSLLPLIINHERIEVGIEWLVTPHNIEAQKQVCRRFMPDSQECATSMTKTVKLMEAASAGEYVREANESIAYRHEKPIETKQPQRVGVLIDKRCASSCEQFLLAIRQSFNVKLLGRRTYGALDYSNLRPHVLPSGNFELYYATSRSLRLPYLPVDAVGIVPDVYLAKNENPDTNRLEVMRVKNWIEGGSLSDTKE